MDTGVSKLHPTSGHDMKHLLIMSIYAPSERNETWYKTQKRFIANNTRGPYDYRILLNGIDPSSFKKEDIAHCFDKNSQHKAALNWFLEYARSHDYENYLFMDSDCFPVSPDWFDNLVYQLDNMNRKLAAPYRTENLDIFPHPCAFFVRGKFIHSPNLNFDNSIKALNLLGSEINDVGSGMASLSNDVFPLLRSNVVNPHPVACAIYSHYFYHHGSGSRDFNFRIYNKFGYTDHWYRRENQLQHGDLLFSAFNQNPEAFINRLMGKDEWLIKDYLL